MKTCTFQNVVTIIYLCRHSFFYSLIVLILSFNILADKLFNCLLLNKKIFKISVAESLFYIWIKKVFLCMPIFWMGLFIK